MTDNRDCYCGSLSDEFLRKEGVPEGFCGICERCGRPGHTQHFPGPVPYTGAWCDRCVKIVPLFYWLKTGLFVSIPLLMVIAIIAIVIKRYAAD